LNNLLYLCCLFVPQKYFPLDRLDDLTSNSEWIEARNTEAAIKEYRKRHTETRWSDDKDVKILAEASRLLNNVKDGENGFMIAKKALIEYLEASNKDFE
jgi:hypothetical protein